MWRAPSSLAQPYRWTWSSATQRTGQAVSTLDLGAIGYQSDIQLEYKLTQVSPAQWSPMPDPRCGPPRSMVAIQSSATTPANAANGWNISVGASALVTPAAGSAGTLVDRQAILTSATAGNFNRIRGNPEPTLAPYRVRMRCTLGAPSTNWWWFMGLAGFAGQTEASSDPANWITTFGIGRGGSVTNTRLYHNDAAGANVGVDLGASFPHATADIMYMLDAAYFGGTSWAYNVRNCNSGVEASGTFATDGPGTANTACWGWYASNNTDNQAVGLHWCDIQHWHFLY